MTKKSIVGATRATITVDAYVGMMVLLFLIKPTLIIACSCSPRPLEIVEVGAYINDFCMIDLQRPEPVLSVVWFLLNNL